MKIIEGNSWRAAILLVLCLLLSCRAFAQEDWFEKGLILIREKQYDAAIKAFSAAIEMIPSDFEAYNYRGLARTYLADYDGAIIDYTKALQIKSGYAEALNNRGFAWVRKGDLKQALDDFSRAIASKPDLLDAYNSKAWILATSSQEAYRNSAEALELAQKAVALNAGVDSLDTLAAAYAAGGQFNEAVAAQTKAVHLLIQQERTAALSPYLARLRSYKARQPLRIEYVGQNLPLEAVKLVPSDQTASPQTPPPVGQVQNENPLAGTHPYTIQVSAYRDPVKSFNVATSLSAKGDLAFACPVYIPGQGLWNRVFIGAYRSLEEARESAVELEKRKFSYIQVTRKPYTVQVGLSDSQTAVPEIISRLRAKGYAAYTLPDRNTPEKIRILIGAYESQDAAGQLAEQLAADGFAPRILPR